MNRFNSYFESLARQISIYAGKPYTFLIAVVLILLWAVTGPLFNYSDTWQLVINTSTTIITFLMIFLVQSSQNRDAKALQLKLDELIFKMRPADNVMINIENLSESELTALAEKYRKLRIKYGKPKKKKKKVPPAELQEAVESVKPTAEKPKPAPKPETETPSVKPA